MKSYQINLFKGHAIIVEGENTILIDTGAPSTIHATNNIEFCGKSYHCTTSQMGLTVEKLAEMLGTKITTLLGTDILSKYKIMFDYRNKLVKFATKEYELNGEEVKISSFMGIPIIELLVSNQPLKFFLDTGAKLSYLSNNFTANYNSVGREVDFYPGVGEFETECYEILTSIGNREFLVKYGNLPDLLQMTLMLGGTNGIIGFDFFNNFKIALDISNRTLKYGD
jgi:hypothetical protein